MNNNFSQKTVVMMVLFVLVVIFTMTWVYKGSVFAKEVIEDGCWREVKGRALAVKFNQEPDTICPTKYETIEDGTNEKIIKEKIAEDTLKCWKTWGSGRENLFIEEEGIFCHICNHYTFEDKSQVISGMSRYLLETEKNGVPYIEQLIPYRTDDTSGIKNKVDLAAPNVFPSVDTSKDWALVFKYVKGKDKIIGEMQKEDTLENVGMGIGAVGAGMAAYMTATTLIGTTAGGVLCTLTGGLGCVAIAVVAGGAGAIPGAMIYAGAQESEDVYAIVRPVVYDVQGLIDSGCEELPIAQSTKGFK